jgi:hypothetical protein
VIDEFVAATFDGLPTVAPGAGLADAMRLTAELPDDPTPEQLDAWVELATLVADEDFRARVRGMAVAGATGPPPTTTHQPDPATVTTEAGAALAAGIAPGSDRGRAVLDRIVDPALDGEDRRELADGIAAFTDRRVERYWQLTGVLNGREPFEPGVPAFEWLVAALRASAQPTST